MAYRPNTRSESSQAHGARINDALARLTAAEIDWVDATNRIADTEEAKLAGLSHAYTRFLSACQAELAAVRAARLTALMWAGVGSLALTAALFVFIQWQSVPTGQGSATPHTAGTSQTSDVEEMIRRAVSDAGRTNATGSIRVDIPSGTFTLRRPLELTGALHLRGAGAGDTIIRSSSAGHIVRITDGSHRIEALTLLYTGSTPAHGILITCCQLELVDVVVEGAVEGSDHLGVGVNIRGTTQALIQSSTIQRNGFGVAVADRANVVIRDSSIVSNRGRGLSLHNSTTGTITNNTIAGNGYGREGTEFWQGIALQNDTRPLIERNEIRGNAGVGIQFWNASAGVVRDNRLVDNGSSIAPYAPQNASAGGIAIGVSGRAADYQPSPTIEASNTFAGNFGGTVRDYR